MAIKIGINGFGRIGRNVFRAIEKEADLEVVAINDLVDPKMIAHLLKYDSVFGRFDGTVEATDTGIVVNKREITITAERDPEKIPWASKDIDIVLESTGIFSKNEQMSKHLKAGAKKVLLSVPPKDEIDAIVVMGVNDDTLKPEHKLISNASCTTNCLAPIAKVLHEEFGIKRGLMTTIHSYTNDQKVLDLPHTDMRRARAAALNMIPTTTGAASAVGKVIPALAGKLHGMAVRVPTPVGSVVDLVVELEKNVTVKDINAAMKKYAENSLEGILKYTEDPIVSSDVIGDPSSSVFDALSTMVMGDNMVKVISWYDNEWGYSNRCVDLFKLMTKGL
jgi:glyceraldehyde 3-phosphate dehydrogenase